jgi:hypothetical protein
MFYICASAEPVSVQQGAGMILMVAALLWVAFYGYCANM